MALTYLYAPLLEGTSFTTNQKAITKLACNIIFTEHNNAVGEFEFTLPVTDRFCEQQQEDDIVSIDNTYFGVIRQLKQVEQGNQCYVVVSGVDLKGYTEQRVTLYPATAIDKGLQGYDAIKGVSTETVTKHFINNNMVSPTNVKRKINGLIIAEDQHRGIESDQYMSRFEQLSEVCVKNLEPQQMGYRINADILSNQFIFDVYKGMDHTASQLLNKRIIFDVKYKNILTFEYFASLKNFKNTFYASLSNAKNEAEAMTCMYQRHGEVEAEGAKRYEQHLNVSVNLPLDDMYNQLKQYALKDASKYEKVETITATTTDKYVFAVDYNLGDFVTIQARQGLFKKKIIKLDVQITSVTHRWTSSGTVIHELGFGTGKISKFDLLERKIMNGGN